jgi:hypothetical protein
VAAAAVEQLHDDPHQSDEQPTAFDLTPDQVAFLKTLVFLSGYQLSHLQKPGPEVAGAIDAGALKTIGGSTVLGGAERVGEIQKLQGEHAELMAIAKILGPLVRLVGQNLLSVDAQLGRHVGEVLKVATSLKGSQPTLLEGLATARAWSKEHHRHSGAGTTTPATTTPAPNAAKS